MTRQALAAVEVRGVSKSYGTTPVLDSLDLEVPTGSVTAILGASGSGKTTLLRLLAGFEHADTGTISITGRVVDDSRRSVRAQHRGIGYVPQDGALFPHLTVLGNVGFGVPRRKRDELPALLDLVGLAGYERRYPHQLSGGQQQRVALARALAIKPKLVLLDEPFGSLDAGLRESVRSEVITILVTTGTSTVLVTHDQDEALSVADHIALLTHGQVSAHGTPRELYDHPSTPAIAAAIGAANILTGRLDGDRVHCLLGVLPVPRITSSASAPAGRCGILLRPEQLQVHATARPGGVPAIVTALRYHGHDTLIDLTTKPDTADTSGAIGDGDSACTDAGCVPLIARHAGPTTLRPGQSVWVSTTETPHLWTGSAGGSDASIVAA